MNTQTIPFQSEALASALAISSSMDSMNGSELRTRSLAPEKYGAFLQLLDVALRDTFMEKFRPGKRGGR